MVLESSGNFKVKSQSGSTLLDASFGDCTNMPKCTCPDFSHTGLPCKHLFAIFSHFPQWQWTSLPMKYREHPNISLDSSLITILPKNTENTNIFNNPSTLELMDSNEDGNIEDQLEELNAVHLEKSIENEGKKCREIYKQLVHITTAL